MFIFLYFIMSKLFKYEIQKLLFIKLTPKSKRKKINSHIEYYFLHNLTKKEIDPFISIVPYF